MSNPIQNALKTTTPRILESAEDVSPSTTAPSKSGNLYPIAISGTGLISDGYLNGIIGPVSTLLTRLHPLTYTPSRRQTISSVTFAGTVLGMLVFGYTSDAFSRKWSLVASTVVMLVFAVLETVAYGAGAGAGAGREEGVFRALAAYRFLLGVGIGGEYPAGSVSAAEGTGELERGRGRDKWFILFTNVQIDVGFLLAAVVPMIVVLGTGEGRLALAWRVCLGVGILPPAVLVWFRWRLREPEAYKKNSLRNAKTPWALCAKFYGARLAVVSAIWFVYDFSAYSFGIYSSTILANLLGPETALWKTFAWNTLLTAFYMPGCLVGAWVSEKSGPRRALSFGMLAQAVVGFVMAGAYGALSRPTNIAGFVVVYGLFIALGEIGPGNNIGLFASKSSATAVRGKYYGIAASVGKIGAFVGSYVFPVIQNNAPNATRAGQDPFFVSSSLSLACALAAFSFLPTITPDAIEQEDVRFQEYLAKHGFDTSNRGTDEVRDTEVQMVKAEGTLAC